jgi:hypothetical protein
MNVSFKKAFSIITFSSVMLTLSIYIGFSMFHQYKFEHCVSVKEGWDKNRYSKQSCLASENAARLAICFKV